MCVDVAVELKPRHIHRRGRKGKKEWVVMVGYAAERRCKVFPDEEHGGCEAALKSAIQFRDQLLATNPPKRQSRSRNAGRNRSEQLRIRLRRDELESFEQARMRARETGDPHADNFSSWVRHQLEPLLVSTTGKEACWVSHSYYQKAKELGEILGKSPEVVIEECVSGILNLIEYSDAQRPLIVAEWRLRQHYRQQK